MPVLSGELLFKTICLPEMVESDWTVIKISFSWYTGYQITGTLECWDIGYFPGECLISLQNSQLAYRPNDSCRVLFGAVSRTL